MEAQAITYQFGANDMIGANGTFSNLHYPNPDQVPGLYDAATRGGSGFYSHRLSVRHYVGVTYQYQDLLSLSGQHHQPDPGGCGSVFLHFLSCT